MGNKAIVAPEPIVDPVSEAQRALAEQRKREVEAVRLILNERIVQLIKDTRPERLEEK